MGTYHVTAARTVNAPARDVYALISNYHTGHPAILPPRYFKALQVVQGGIGAGTVVDVDMEVFGVKAHYHLTVSEPDPGHILQEEDPALGTLTTFTVEPINETQSEVTIATTMRAAPGIRGWIEKLMNPPVMRKIYREELAQLDDVAQRSQ
ncbi:MAG: SRPBCC family protein [Caldilineaceae bacterium]|nr:SRPBCC family protein [Caldilineaceae bacterium]